MSGTNYNIVLDFVNKLNEKKTYEVIIYSAPWMGVDQVVSSLQISDDYQAMYAAIVKSFSELNDNLNEEDGNDKIIDTNSKDQTRSKI